LPYQSNLHGIRDCIENLAATGADDYHVQYMPEQGFSYNFDLMGVGRGWEALAEASVPGF